MGSSARDAGLVPPSDGVGRSEGDGAGGTEHQRQLLPTPADERSPMPTGGDNLASQSAVNEMAVTSGIPPVVDMEPSPALSHVSDIPAVPGDAVPDGHGAPRYPVDVELDLQQTFEAVVSNVRSAYVGRGDIVRLAVCCLLAEGHLLVEDHPGVGKTTLAKALARSLGLGFGRIQFTADLLPADVTGAVIFDQKSGHVVFRPGPVFTNVLLADELNRASPKAQSALLEAMEERQVSADGVSHQLPEPFMVLATQNPYDAAGTFPLPHSQRDRFLLRLSLGYPDRAAEDELLATAQTRPTPEALSSVGGPGFIRRFGAAVDAAYVAPEVRAYVLDLVAETRAHPDLAVGASPRATLCTVRVAAAVAVASGRDYVTPDDVKLVAEPTLGHRVVVHPAAELAGVTAHAVIDEIVSRLVVPIGST